MTCPNCGCKASNAIYMGIPVKFCESCGTLWGFWSWIIELAPVPSHDADGESVWSFMLYEHWLLGKDNEN